jgi:hypothetical protein
MSDDQYRAQIAIKNDEVTSLKRSLDICNIDVESMKQSFKEH